VKKVRVLWQGPYLSAAAKCYEEEIFPVGGPSAAALSGGLTPSRQQRMRSIAVCGSLPESDGAPISIQHGESNTGSIGREFRGQHRSIDRNELSGIGSVDMREVQILTGGIDQVFPIGRQTRSRGDEIAQAARRASREGNHPERTSEGGGHQDVLNVEALYQ
jgi:hypothetical protein